MIVYLNKKILDENLAHISIGDAGFLFGEGVFTTMRLYGGVAPDLENHLQRLRHQAAALQIPFSLTAKDTRGIITELLNQNEILDSDARLRITITRGADPDNPLPIIPSAEIPPTVLITVAPLAPSADETNRQGISIVTLGREFMRTHSPHLKSLNYLPSLLALREARTRGCSEAVILDENDCILEGATSNIFLVKDGALFTPADSGRILPGITRLRILELASQNDLTCHEIPLPHIHLKTADEIFLCNSIRQVVPVLCIDEIPVGRGKPGPVTMKISQWYDRAMNNPGK